MLFNASRGVRKPEGGRAAVDYFGIVILLPAKRPVANRSLDNPFAAESSTRITSIIRRTDNGKEKRETYT